VLFHRPSLLAYGGLSDSVEARGFRKAFSFYEVREDLKIVDLHRETVEVEWLLQYLISPKLKEKTH